MKLLSVDELFAKRSLQEHLQKVEKEYNECLKAVTYSVTEDGCSEDEMKAKRTKISLLAPLIQSIRELDKKQKEISETEMLLKGVVAECQQERSQLKNREKAMKALRAKLYSMKLEEETNKNIPYPYDVVINRGRSEKIRTYNYAQDRITDHRISMTVHDVKSFLLGEDLLNEMNSSLQDFSNQETLMELLEEGSQEEP
ncbi:hypothetical protein XENOCAPTIV_011921 [Xenoophorus captivus]|uniref:Prokaryotic-type class I peptide chain release factors domain-containing protein n=1 Tax=Xenoophorus captivus TaxID=1517983 RepID=A0ABV0RZ38_9TELE